MKVSLITVVNINNYGSMLQAYATQSCIEAMGHSVELVNYVSANGNVAVEAETACEKRNFRPGIKKEIYKKAWMLNQWFQSRPFDNFRNSFLKLGHLYKTQDELKSHPPVADAYVSGSDMLWNTKLNRGHNEKQFYLEFAPADKPRIAFSASIGEESISEEECLFMKPLLEKYDSISMREESGVKLLESMGFESEKVLDPTLMLTSDDWLQLADQKSILSNYVFVYFLHDHPEELKAAREYANKRGMRMVRLAFNPLKKASDDKIVFMPSVEQCVALFANASCVITDSFHGTCFALNFQREFFTTRPPRFVARITDILALANAENRLFQGDSIPVQNDSIDYESFNALLLQERKKSMSFLERALNES